LYTEANKTIIHIPHTRGGEPPGNPKDLASLVIFPTPVGVNRRVTTCAIITCHIPHTRGGEPQTKQ